MADQIQALVDDNELYEGMYERIQTELQFAKRREIEILGLLKNIDERTKQANLVLEEMEHYELQKEQVALARRKEKNARKHKKILAQMRVKREQV